MLFPMYINYTPLSLYSRLHPTHFSLLVPLLYLHYSRFAGIHGRRAKLTYPRERLVRRTSRPLAPSRPLAFFPRPLANTRGETKFVGSRHIGLLLTPPGT